MPRLSAGRVRDSIGGADVIERRYWVRGRALWDELLESGHYRSSVTTIWFSSCARRFALATLFVAAITMGVSAQGAAPIVMTLGTATLNDVRQFLAIFLC